MTTEAECRDLHRLVMLLCNHASSTSGVRARDLALLYATAYDEIVTSDDVKRLLRVAWNADPIMAPPREYLQLVEDKARKCFYTWVPTAAGGYLIGTAGDGIKFFRSVFHVSLHLEVTTLPMQRVTITTQCGADYVREVVLPVIANRISQLVGKLTPATKPSPPEENDAELEALLPRWLIHAM